MNESPDISSFQYDKSGNGTIEGSVNMYRGAVCFDYSIAELVKHGGIGISVSASYYSDVDKIAALCNDVSPTGVMGLGFRLTYDTIECDRGDCGKPYKSRKYRLTTGDNSGAGNRLHLIGEDDYILIYESESYDYCKIEFNTHTSLWTITDANGIKRIFGGNGGYSYSVLSAGRYATFPCTDCNVLSNDVKAWNLTEIISPSGNDVRYEYDYTYRKINAQSSEEIRYTKETYIKSISDSFGNSVSFMYGDKLNESDGVQEYVDPYRLNDEDGINPYQSEYETKYLAGVDVSDSAGKLYYVCFGYEFMNFDKSSDEDGKSAKRMLVSAQMQMPSDSLPPMTFEYCSADGVNGGALKKVTYPEGGTAEYSYTENKTILSISRSETISNEGYSEKAKVYFGDDYAVVIQQNSDDVSVSIFRWTGRWQRYTPENILTGIDTETLDVVATVQYAVICASTYDGKITKCICFTKKRKVIGGWNEAVLKEIESGDVTIIAGNDWFLLHDRDNDTIIPMNYNAAEERWDEGNFPDSMSEDGFTRLFRAYGDRLICFAPDGNSSDSYELLKLYTYDALDGWKLMFQYDGLDIRMIVKDGCDPVAYFDGYTVAGSFITDHTENTLVYRFMVFRVTENRIVCEISESISLPTGDVSCIVPEIDGNTVISAGYLWRFTGTEWISDRTLAIQLSGKYQFSLYSDIAASVAVIEGTMYVTTVTFDMESNCYSHRQLCVEKSDDLPPYGVSISGNIAVLGNSVYDISDLTFDKVLEKLDGNLGTANLFNNGVCLVSAQYEKEDDDFRPVSSYIHTIFNNRIAAKTFDDSPYIEGCSGSGDILCIGDLHKEVKLLYAGNGNPSENVVFCQASSVTLDDGMTCTRRTYEYDCTYASCDTYGQFARYSAVTVMNDNDEGNRTQYRFYDSVSQSQASDNMVLSSVEDGTVVSVESFCDGRLKNRFTAAYTFTDMVNGKRILGNVVSNGSFIEKSDMNPDGTGLEKKTEFTADPMSGMKLSQTTINYNVCGEMETHLTMVVPAYQDNRLMLDAHRLCEVSREETSVCGILTSCRKTEYGVIDGILDVVKITETDPAGKRDRVESENLHRGKFGVILAKKGVFNEYFISDRSGVLRIAEFTDSLYGECFAYTFEEYENEMKIVYSDASITDSVSFVGSRCLEIKPGGSCIINHSFTASGNDYALQFFAKGKLDVKICSGGKKVSRTYDTDDFKYVFVDLRELTPNVGCESSFDIVFENSSDAPVFVDIVAFFNMYCPPRIHVFSKGGSLLLATVSGYGNVSENIFDGAGRTVCIVYNKKVINTSVPSPGRITGRTVNSDISLKSSGKGGFVRGIAADEKYSPDVSGDYVLFVRTAGDFELAVSDDITVSRSGKIWSIDKSGNVSKVDEGCGTSCGSITLLYTGIIAIFADGKLIDSWKREKTLAVRPSVSASLEITELAWGENPSGSARYSDFGGKLRQEHTLSGDNVSLVAMEYDIFGRKIAQTLPIYTDGKPLEYIDGYIDEIDSRSGKMSGKINNVLGNCDGYPYIPQAYEQRPDGRKLESGTPCAEYAINYGTEREKRHTTRISYAYGKGNTGLLSSLTSECTAVTTLDPDNNTITTLYDIRKKKIADYIMCSGVELLTTYSYSYEKAFMKKTITTPAGTKRIMCYDYSNRLFSVEDVNAGISRSFYDINGNLRFIVNSENSKEKLCSYRKYDRHFRLVEEGMCGLLSDEELEKKTDIPVYPTEGTIISRRYFYDGNFSADEMGLMSRIEIYDESADNILLSSVSVSGDRQNNTVSKKISTDNEEYVSTFVYDNSGKIVKEISTQGKTLIYSYDSAMRVSSICTDSFPVSYFAYRADDLPEKIITDGNEMIYSYNARGKITGIISPFYSEKISYLENGKYYNGKLRSVETTVINGESSDSLKYELEYDENGQLRSAVSHDRPDMSLSDICYDRNGNIISCNVNNLKSDFLIENGTDKLLSARGVSYSYDSNGSVRTRNDGEELRIEYYKYSGLPRNFVKGKQKTEILYDEAGNRLKKKVTSGDTDKSEQVYINDGNRIAEEIRNGKSIRYVTGPSGLSAVLSDDSVYSVITDRLGYTKVVAQCKKIIQAYHYKPFGELVEIVNESELVKLLFGKYEFDSVTGLYNAKNRMYDPKTFRFMSPDSKGEFASPYVFCGNDPFAVIDEDGNTSFIAALIGTVVGIVLTIGLSVLTMGAAAPVAVGILGAETAASTTLTASVVVYNTIMTGLVTAISGFASQGTMCIIDGESFTAAAAGDILLTSVVSGLVFGGVGTIVGTAARTSTEGIKGAAKVGRYLAQGAILSVANGSAAAVTSPLSDLMNGEDVDGMSAFTNAAFGALSGVITTFASSMSDLIPNKKEMNKIEILKNAVNDTIWGAGDPGVYYGAASDVVDSGTAVNTHDDFSIGNREYIRKDKSTSSSEASSADITVEYACFSGKKEFPRNIVSPRYFATRGFGQSLI